MCYYDLQNTYHLERAHIFRLINNFYLNLLNLQIYNIV